MPIFRYLLSVSSLVSVSSLGILGLGVIGLGSAGSAKAVQPSPDRPILFWDAGIRSTSVAQASSSRAADCNQMGKFLDEVTRAFEGMEAQNSPSSEQAALAQMDSMLSLLNSYIGRLQGMQLTDPQVRQFRGRYITAFQEIRQFLQTVRAAGLQGDEAMFNQAMERFLQNLESYGVLDESFRQYCGFATTTPRQPPTQQQPQQPQQPSRPSTTTQQNRQTQQLNTQLRAAVNAKDWNRAIQLVDRLIVLHPERASELQRYRARLVQLRNAQQ